MKVVKSVLVLLSVILVLATAGLVVVGGGDAHWEDVGRMRIDRPKEQVLDWLTDPGHRRKWIGGLVDSRNDGRIQQGTQLRETIEIDGREYQRIVEITEFVEGEVVAFWTNYDGVELKIRFELSVYRSNRRSTVRYTVLAEYPGWWSKIVEPILSNSTSTRLREDLERLKVQLESTP